MLKLSIITKFFALWMVFITSSITYIGLNSNDNKFFRFGPNKDFIVFRFAIDTWEKYIAISMYCICNAAIRCINLTVLIPWMINNVQNEHAIDKDKIMLSYEVSLITSIYSWFDWFISLNLLLSQVDMVLFESLSDIATALITTQVTGT